MPPRSERNIQFSGPAVPAFLQKLHAQVNGGRGASGGGGGQASSDALAGPGGGGAGRGGGEDEWDQMFSSSSGSRGGRGAEEGLDGDGEGEEWDGAQVVVLKEGRHLTADDVRRLRDEEVDAAASAPTTSASTSKPPSIATPSSAHPSKRPRRDPVLSTETEEAPLLALSSSSSSSGPAQMKRQKTNPTSKGKREEKDPLSSVRALIEADRRSKDGKDTKTSEGKSKGGGKDDAASKKERKRREVEAEKMKRGKGLSFGFED